MKVHEHPNHLPCRPASSLLTATVVVILGTAWVDPSRLWLLVVPATFLIMAFAGGTLADRAIGGLLVEADAPPMLNLAVHVGVGLACLSLLAVLSALGGMLWIAGIAAVPLLVYGLLRVVRAGLHFRPVRGVLSEAAGGLAMGGAWLVAWLWATIPPTFFDELSYHLVVPQRALVSGKLEATPWVFYTLMPNASDLLLAWGMAFGGDLGARATLFALWVACWLSVWGLAEAVAWPKSTMWAAPLVASGLATSPTFWFLGTLSFAETCLAAAMVTAAAIIAFPHAEHRSWLSLGLTLGLAATTKLSGLFWVAAALAAAFIAGWSRRDIIKVTLVALACIAPWWARAFYFTGNPVYPMWYKLLGGSPWSDESQARTLADLPYSTGGLGLTGLLHLPLDLVQHPERFGSASDVGVVAVVAVCLMLAFPAISRVAGLGTHARRSGDAAAIFVLITATVWAVTTPTTRYFAPAFVIGLSILAGATFCLPHSGQVLALLVMLTAGVWGTSKFVAQHSLVFSSYDVAMGRENAEHYASRQLDHYAAARYVRESLPSDARLLFIGESRPYYFRREAVAPSAYDRHPLQRWVEEAPSVEALVGRLAAAGITHVVLNVHEFKRLHDHYGLLDFRGEGSKANDARLKALPRVLRLLFSQNGVYIFEVPALFPRGQGKAP